MKQIRIIHSIVVFSLFLLSSSSSPAQPLQGRIKQIQEKIAQIKSYPSIRMQTRIITMSNLSAGEKTVDLQEGEYIYLSNKAAFNGFVFTSTSLEDCLIQKSQHNEETILKTIVLPGKKYIQSGDTAADDVLSLSGGNDIFSTYPTYVLHTLEQNLSFLESALTNHNLRSEILPIRIDNGDNPPIVRYEVLIPTTEEISDTVTRIDFSPNESEVLPTFFSVGGKIKKTNKTFVHWSLALKTLSDSPLGYTEYEYKTYYPDNPDTVTEQQFSNDPNSFMKMERSMKVTILNTPVVNGTVFLEEFSFFIPKGKALIVHNENPGSEPQRIVSEEDRIFTP